MTYDDAPDLTCTCGRTLRIEQGDGRLFVVCRCGLNLDLQPKGRWTDPQTKAEGPACYVCTGSGRSNGFPAVLTGFGTVPEKAVTNWIARLPHAE